jgi:MoaA/NifB/PqqE/SkfB family radical SAM enzyme
MSLLGSLRRSLRQVVWSFRHARLKSRGWHNHPRGDLFLSRGGDKVGPPLQASLGITDICNLRCSICGSQNQLAPINRRHMDYKVFSQVADTLFPILHIVEFNSRGEPLLHPHMERMLEKVIEHDIFLRLQTNGTQFSESKIRLLSKIRGRVSISIDATGELFEYARKLGKWDNVDAGVRAFMKARDRRHLTVTLYPTLTEKTITGARELLDWAKAVGVDLVEFHSFDPNQTCQERAPTSRQLAELKNWAAGLEATHPMGVSVDFEDVKPGRLHDQSPPLHTNMPRRLDQDGMPHPRYVCPAPVQHVDIDLDGCVSICCRMQEYKLGNALTPAAFADCWFGEEYQALRASLRRDDFDPLYESCRGCVNYYTAETASKAA